MKEWACVQVKHHKDVGRTIEEYQRKGWRLHTYSTSGHELGQAVHVLAVSGTIKALSKKIRQ